MQKTTQKTTLVHAGRTARRPGTLARYGLLAVMLLLLVAPAPAQWTNNQAAANALGQPDLNSNTPNNGGVSNTSLLFPVGAAVDPTTGKVFVTDTANHRVLRFSSMAAMLNGQAAEGVLGQPDFTTTSVGATQSKISRPIGAWVDAAGRLWIGDTDNHRVLRFDNAASKPNGAPADGVLGQPDFTSNSFAVTQSGMREPTSVFIDSAGRLWVADFASHRVLRFDQAAAKPNGANADGVLGQPDFTSGAPAITQSGMRFPTGLFVDGGGRLWVTNWQGHRVLRFDNAAAKANGANADGVLGQPDFTSNTAATTQNGMNRPWGVFIDPAGRLYVSEQNNNRILIFNNAATLPNGAQADNVLGQPDFTTGTANTGGVSATALNGPQHLFFDAASFALFVGDIFNHRVKRYAIAPPVWTNNQPALNVVGQPDFAARHIGHSENTLHRPSGVAVDPTTGKVFVADTLNHRVLRFSAMAVLLAGQAAECVLGQPNFTNHAPASTPSRMRQPLGIAVDGAGRLWVADSDNHRVLRFDAAATKANGAAADGVLGQPDFDSAHPDTSQHELFHPSGVAVDTAGRLWVADTHNHRVLRFDNAATKANGAQADGVLGQPNFNSHAHATTQSGLKSPTDVWLDAAGRLWVADTDNNRVLRFDAAASKANGAQADGVLGQADFSSQLNTTTQSGLRAPNGLTGDPAGRLYVSDEKSHRVLIFENAATLGHGAPADHVLGQADFNDHQPNQGGVSATSLFNPRQLCFDPATFALYVADSFNNRVKRYALP